MSAAVVAAALDAAGRAERAGKLDEALTIVEEARTRLGERADQGSTRAAAAVLAVVASRLTLAIRGPEPALALAELARGAPVSAWSVRAAAELAAAAAHLRVHTAPALEPARAGIAAAMAAVPDGANADTIDEITAAAVATAGAAARFLCRGSLQSHALELRGLIAARTGEVRAALDDLDAAYRAGDGDPDRRARALLAWGLQLRNWGLLDEALRRVERSLELRLELDDLHGAAICQGVIAFIHQRRGDYLRERDALAADLRLSERIGSDGDLPGLRARLAGALVGLGKYAAAFAEAAAAITGEDARLAAAKLPAPTRIHGFAWREQARVRLAEGRLDDADALLDRATRAFADLGDAYARALCEITRAQVALARAVGAATPPDREAALARLATARAAAAPVFSRLGAIVEAAELALLSAEAAGFAGRGSSAATSILTRVIPALISAGFADTPLCTRARQLAEHLSPEAVRADVVARAAALPALASKVLEEDAS